MRIWSLESIAAELDVTVFISCYNEQDYITDTVEEFSEALESLGLSYEIIIIDDTSADNSVRRLEEYIEKKRDAHLFLKANERNCGLAFNFVEAAYIGRGKYYRLMTGDNPEPKEETIALFKHLGEADILLPYREVDTRTRLRWLISRLFVFAVNLISGYRIKYYNGAPVFLRSHVIRWHPHSYGFGFQADLITRLLDEGCSYIEVPVNVIEKKGGNTSIGMRNILSVLHTLVEISFRRLRSIIYSKPGHLT